MRIKGKILTLALACAMLVSSCGTGYYVENRVYEDFDVKNSLGIEFPAEAFDFGELAAPAAPEKERLPNRDEADVQSFEMRTVDKMQIYKSPTDAVASSSISANTVVVLTETTEEGWMKVSSTEGVDYGYTNEGFLKAINSGVEVYAELPIEYGTARNNYNEYKDAYSHLVDISKYLKVYYSLDQSNEGVDLSEYDVKVSMKLATQDTSIGEPFYTSNLCMLQYDTLQLLMKAIKSFKKAGYTVVIYDAYRPTSVQQRWFDVVKVHKWVADPSRGMGGIHDRGTAIDMSLINTKTGEEIEMPTPMHTFTNDSARDSENMTDEARANMDYMMRVMVASGFTYINSEWWHFQDRNTQYYLPTDHPIDSIPLAPSEITKGDEAK